jgi:hypothetical protein
MPNERDLAIKLKSAISVNTYLDAFEIIFSESLDGLSSHYFDSAYAVRIINILAMSTHISYATITCFVRSIHSHLKVH